jgi:hypothetical protein
MAHRMNDNLGLGNLVENNIRVGWCRQAADHGIVRLAPDVGMEREKVGHGLDPRLNSPRSL